MRAPSSILVALIALPLAASADPALPGPAYARGLTLGLTAVQPLPPWSDAGFGVAPWVGVSIPAWGDLLATARVGYIQHLDRNLTVGGVNSESISYSSWELSVLVGVEYARPGRHGLVLSAEAGYVLHMSGADYAYEADASATDHRAAIALGVGYRLSSIEARVHWVMLGLPDPVKKKAIMLGVQWSLPM